MDRVNDKNLRVMISGGGTGGHVYPALAIADAIKAVRPDAEIRFVGAEGRMEMEKVPQHGYPIDGIWISGFQRSNMLKNLLLPFKLLSSMNKVSGLLKKYRPHVAVGVGGYASGPLLHLAARKKIPTLIQEQNSYPGVTNKMLAKRVNTICVAYPGLEKYFPAGKIVLTGNPVRQFKPAELSTRSEAYRFFNLQPDKPTILVIGGSGGARTMNESILGQISKLASSPVQLIWQTGKYYYDNIKQQLPEDGYGNIQVLPFIDRMDLAYAAADIVVSRAGAISISELALLHKPCVLVPSPNVAEDHQTKNAQVLVEKNAAIMVTDAEARQKLVDAMLYLAVDSNKQQALSREIAAFAKPDAAADIVKEILKLVRIQ